jgi:hypothetical protein
MICDRKYVTRYFHLHDTVASLIISPNFLLGDFMKIRDLVVCASLLVPVVSFADGKPSLHDQFTGQGFGMAGCGLGSIVFGKEPGGKQIFASTTNGTFGSQTFGISSGTSNCTDAKSKDGLFGFVKTNKNQLMTDVAKGSGESLAGLNLFMGCKDSTKLNQHLQGNFAKIFVEGQDDSQLTDSILTSTQNDVALKDSCDILI